MVVPVVEHVEAVTWSKSSVPSYGGSADGSSARSIPNKALATRSKWEGEDEDDDGPVVSLSLV